MSLLQIFFIVSSIIILFLSIDIAKKQQFNALHFFVFLGMGIGLLIFTFFPSILNIFGKFFGLQRGADLLVYVSITFLVYFVLLLLSKHVENKQNITKLVRELAIENSYKKNITGNEVFLIRVYNEEEVLKETLDNLLNNGFKNLLIINDGSTDNSKKILEKYGDKIILVNHPINRGGGAALKTGIEYLKRYGKTKYIVTFDADGQHNIKDLPKFFNLIKNKKLDIVLGSRFIKKTQTNIPLHRKIILYGGRIFTYLLSGIYLTDAHNGYRVFKSKIIDKIEISMDGMEYASEIIDSINKNNLKYGEVPVNIKYTKYSLKKGQKTSNAFNIAIRFIWNKFFK